MGSNRLGRYILRRLLQAVPLVVGVIIITFLLVHIAPGDPLTILAGDGGNAAYYAEMRARYGLDKPLPEQLGRYLLQILQADFGYSFSYQQPVFQVILSRIPATLLLMGTALVLSTLLGVGLGMLAARRSHGWLDYIITIFTSVFYSVPVFWLGQLLVLALAVGFKLFPVSGMVSVRENYTGFRHALDIAHHLSLPALTLALSYMALTTRLTRTSLREALAEDYVRTAYAKGLPNGKVTWRHAMRNAWLPVITLIGGQIGFLVTGAALTETIFAWPGVGRLLLDASLQRDYPLLMAIFMTVSLTVIVANLLTDLVYTLLDPRIRYS
jgi:peptide/nickel transport system permease protein